MKRLMVFIAAFGTLFLAPSASAQSSLPPDPNNREPEYVRRMRENREYWDRINGRDSRGMIANREMPRRVPRKYPDGKPYSKEELEKIEALKRPSEADAAVYADFLKQPRTGIFRIFPYLQCTEKGLIRVDGQCADYVFDSWAYSFRIKNYTNPIYFDLKYKDDNLVTGSLLALGILTPLGNVPVENVSLTGDGMKFLTELKPETEHKKVEEQINSFVKGVEEGGYKYSSKTKIEVNMTYGLRVVAYRMPNKVRLLLGDDSPLSKLIPNFSYPLNKFDERDDIIVAFRIIRKEADGNLTIVWKALSRRDAPELVFPKDVKTVTVNQKPE